MVTDAKIVAVAQTVFPANGNPCFQSQCPVTPRLLNRLQTSTAEANLWTRSQFPWPNPSFTAQTTSTGGIAHVVFPAQGSEGSNRVDLIMTLNSQGVLLVDDEVCTATPNASTSIYVAKPPLCYPG